MKTQVIIVGGGPVGLMCALGLAQGTNGVSVIDSGFLEILLTSYPHLSPRAQTVARF
jgi:2-polyprenyl-6-methoxyphenol hydroxylase-like FAD-dependent oxidoreductase